MDGFAVDDASCWPSFSPSPRTSAYGTLTGSDESFLYPMDALRMAATRYLVFDIESIADGDWCRGWSTPARNCQPMAAVTKYRQELFAKYESDFVPYTFQLPMSIAVAKVDADFA